MNLKVISLKKKSLVIKVLKQLFLKQVNVILFNGCIWPDFHNSICAKYYIRFYLHSPFSRLFYLCGKRREEIENSNIYYFNSFQQFSPHEFNSLYNFQSNLYLTRRRLSNKRHNSDINSFNKVLPVSSIDHNTYTGIIRRYSKVYESLCYASCLNKNLKFNYSYRDFSSENNYYASFLMSNIGKILGNKKINKKEIYNNHPRTQKAGKLKAPTRYKSFKSNLLESPECFISNENKNLFCLLNTIQKSNIQFLNPNKASYDSIQSLFILSSRPQNRCFPPFIDDQLKSFCVNANKNNVAGFTELQDYFRLDSHVYSYNSLSVYSVYQRHFSQNSTLKYLILSNHDLSEPRQIIHSIYNKAIQKPVSNNKIINRYYGGIQNIMLNETPTNDMSSVGVNDPLFQKYYFNRNSEVKEHRNEPRLFHYYLKSLTKEQKYSFQYSDIKLNRPFYNNRRHSSFSSGIISYSGPSLHMKDLLIDKWKFNNLSRGAKKGFKKKDSFKYDRLYPNSDKLRDLELKGTTSPKSINYSNINTSSSVSNIQPSIYNYKNSYNIIDNTTGTNSTILKYYKAKPDKRTPEMDIIKINNEKKYSEKSYTNRTFSVCGNVYPDYSGEVFNINVLTEKVYTLLEKKIRDERDSRGK